MKKIVGIFKTEEHAIKAIEGLRSSGYTDDEISIITKDDDKYDSLTDKVGKDITNNKEVASGAAAGAVTGGTIGGLGGLLLGLGALAIPGVGPIVAAGPIAAAITGALAGGAVGGLAGALVDYGVPEVEAKEYEERINDGDILVLVDDDEVKRDKAYDSFYESESLNRDTYSHRDRTVSHENPIAETHTGTTNYDKNSYKHTEDEDLTFKVDKNKDLDKILDKKVDPQKISPAHEGRIDTNETKWNEEVHTDTDRENAKHVVEGHERNLDEDKPFEAEKPYDLDKNLRDVDKF